ncbi:hypothetical protein DPEC_G00344830 [Dallia pectoralis]|uniref:Uncharacterized protein n=1 Tax=Dallia pectoralis TaxID=75939 RepID=A0ACC2F3B9_DALPE|nr:hypothetical protein DPEC_G00344830 [Dallia pectoralis]
MECLFVTLRKGEGSEHFAPEVSELSGANPEYGGDPAGTEPVKKTDDVPLRLVQRGQRFPRTMPPSRTLGSTSGERGRHLLLYATLGTVEGGRVTS